MGGTTTRRTWRYVRTAVMTRVAAIDVGTNSTNLLVIDEHGTESTRVITSTRLGEGLQSTGELSLEAMTRTVEVIASYVTTAQSLGVTNIQIVGTAACRRARNAASFSEVLSESDEAALTFSGALIGLPVIDTPTLVIDIGGGSTEYTVGTESIDVFASIPFGAVTSTDSHISSDLPRPEDLTNLIGAVSDELEDITRDHPIVGTAMRTVGVAGTIVTIAAVELGLHEFDDSALHGMALSREAVEDVFRTMATEPLALRVQNPGLGRDRADIIVAGCCILVATMRRLRLAEITVSTRGLLDGVAHRVRLNS
jgi:exopolyphosphatase/guanosine-5'-triphosphate,3'-diphosphate pyrophosphatase